MFTENLNNTDQGAPECAGTVVAAAPAKPAHNAFEALNLHANLLRALRDAGYSQPTDVQTRAVPAAIENRDLRVQSNTGSGKTAAFMLPALQGILNLRASTERRERGVAQGPRILVLTPTRELAIQVSKAALTYGRHVQGLRVATVVGGVPYGAQLKALRGPLDILIATPGRLMDHMNSGKLVLDGVATLVLDEADRMLDMGFIDDIRYIAECTPKTRQTLMFSATFAGHVGRLANELLKPDARAIEVASHTDTHANIEQRLHWADNRVHKDALLDHILTDRAVEQALVFTSTQRDADWLADRLADMGHHVASLHGGHPQGRRNKVLEGLRSKHLKILVATDVAARGIDVPSISHVINYGLPMKAEDYVHRIGRTGRAGRNGLAVTLAERFDVGMIRRIQQFTTQDMPVALIAGLEPKLPEPRMFAPRKEGSTAGKPFNKGFKPGGAKSFGAKPFGSKPFGSKPFGNAAAPRHASAGGERPHYERADAGRAPFGAGEQRAPARKPGGFSATKGPFAGKTSRTRAGGFDR